MLLCLNPIKISCLRKQVETGAKEIQLEESIKTLQLCTLFAYVNVKDITLDLTRGSIKLSSEYCCC